MRDVPKLVNRSLAVEAKISDWRRGVGQLTRAQWGELMRLRFYCHARSSILSRGKSLRSNRIGLLTAYHSEISWQVRAPVSELSWIGDIWLTELAIRAVERSTV